MNVDVSSDLELGAEVRNAARAFAAALSETPERRAFQQAVVALREDVVAGRAIDAYQKHAKSLRSLMMLGAISDQRQAELDRLRQASEQQPSVVAYLAAQHDLMQLAQAADGQLSAQIGIDFATACGAAAAPQEHLNEPETLPAALSDAADALAAALQASPAFVALTAAEKALFADASAATILEQYTTAQRRLRALEMDGSLTQDDLSRADELEQQVEEQVLIAGYLAAQQDALALLPEVYRTISQLLGVDFTWLTRRSCC
jgi:cell fate (sporulation/competence/biofilm development) regulator YlbF (YheA/YmcA/DUF963 family)